MRVKFLLAVNVDLGSKDAADGEERFDGGARRRVINSLVDAFGDAGGRAASRQNVAKDDDK